MAVEVLGINPKTSVYMLELFFENTRKCGGGEIKQLLFDQDKHTAIIWFEDENVSHRCQEFCTTSNVELENYPLTVKIYKGLESVAEVPGKEKLRNATTAKPRQTQRIAVDPTTSHGHSGAGARGPARRDGKATGQRDGRATGQRDGRATGQRDAISSRPDLERSQLAEYDFCTVELSNIPVETTRDYLQLVVESVFPEVGDTAIKEFNYADGDQRGWIKLRRKEDAHEIVMSSPLDVDGTPVHVVPLNTLLEDDPDYQGSAAIRVTNIPDGVSNQHIKLLFKNQKRTGGGAIADIYSEKGIVCITYEESCVAKAVLERHNKKLLQCKEQTLAIERLCPVPPPPLCLGQKECARLLLTALPDFITGSDITKFLNPDGGCDVSTILFSCKPGVALVVFVGSPDYEALLWRCGTRPLKGTMVSIQEIPLPRHIQVHGLQSLDTEIVELYFEDEADVVNSYISSDKSWMIIQFSNPEAVMRTTKHKHELEDVLMKVEVYYPDFGEYPPGVDMTQPLPERHATITLTTGGPVGRFIFKSPQAIDYLNDQLKPVNATLQLDSSSEEQLTLLCLSTVAASEIKLWKDTATNRFEDLLADTFEARDLALDGELYQHVSREAHKHARKHRLVITTDDDSKTIALVGWKKEVRDAEASLSQQCQAIEDEKSADKCVIPVRREDALLLSASDFSTTIANTFARLNVTIGEEEVILHGPTRYMSDAKVKMYEDYIRKKTSRDEVTSPDVLNLLQMDNAANRVRAALAEAEVCVAWHITDGKLTLIALNEDALDTAMSVMKESVVSKKRELDPAESAAVQTHVWKDLIQSLEKAHKGLLVFNHGPQEVRWACVKDIAEIIEAVVNDYLAEHVIHEELVPADPGVVEVLDQYGDVRSVAKQTNVKLESRWEVPQGAGFLIKGTRADLEAGRKRIKECISFVVCKDLVLNAVRDFRFIKSPKCELVLADLRSMYRCAIRVVKEGGDPERAADEADKEDSLEDSSIASSVFLLPADDDVTLRFHGLSSQSLHRAIKSLYQQITSAMRTEVIGEEDQVALPNLTDLERSKLAEYDFCTVELSNIPVETTRDNLQLVVESVLPDADTAIKEFNYADGDQRGWIKFRRKEDANELVLSSPLDVDGTPVYVVPLNTLLEDDPDYQGSAAVRVTNIPDGVSPQHIQLLFKNKKSGGGPIEDVYIDEITSAVYITYEESCVAKAVLERHNKKPLQCKEQTLAMERLCPVPPPPLCLGPKECDRLLLTALPDSITGSDIAKFLNQDGDCDVSTILFSCKPGVALVIFVDFPSSSGYEALLWRCGTRPLKGTMVSIQEIPLPRHIQVHGLQSLNTEMVKQYFDSDTEVVSSYISPNKTWMIIQLPNPEDVERTTRREHKLDGVLMKVEVYYPDFGEYPPSVDMTQPPQATQAANARTTSNLTDTLQPSWSPSSNPASVKRVFLRSKRVEYQQVERRFRGTIKMGTIQKIERIQNAPLYKQYDIHKTRMDADNPTGHQNERILYHGTSVTTVDKINRNGFDRSFCGKNGVAFDSGVCFTRDARYSTYSPTDANGIKYIYQCKVLTGEYTLGARGMSKPPQKPGKSAAVLFDSLVNNVTTPSIFVIFNDNRAYPEYLIHYKI